MKAYHRVIVNIPQVYKDKIGSVYIDVNRDDVQYINREVKVVSAPEYTPLKTGDKLIIHHNILRQKIGLKGALVNSDYYIKDGYYNCPLEEIFLFKRGDDKWKTFNPHVFVKPIPYKNETKTSLILDDKTLESFNDNYKGFNKEKGILKYLNEDLIEMGLKEGDVVIFARDSEYEFNIEGELLYKMKTSDILAKVEK